MSPREVTTFSFWRAEQAVLRGYYAGDIPGGPAIHLAHMAWLAPIGMRLIARHVLQQVGCEDLIGERRAGGE